MENKGAGAIILYDTAASRVLGRVLAARTGVGLCAVAMADTDAELLLELSERFPAATLQQEPGGLAEELAHVQLWLDGEQDPELPALDLAGTAFERRVWSAMRQIPRGATTEYGRFAADLGMPGGSRAVGAAIGKNPLALLFPCHRLVARGGKLHRYRWGLERKELLLRRERTQTGCSAATGRPVQGYLPWAPVE